MKQPDATGVIEFSSKRIMANMSNILLVVAFLASLSLSASLVTRDLNIFKNYETYLNNDVPQYLREKRQENAQDSHEKKHDTALLKELSEFQTIHDRRSTEGDVRTAEQKSDVKNEKQKTANSSNEIEKDAQNVLKYRSMHDLIQALILADEEDIAMRLQQLHEIENAKESEKLKRQVSSSAAAAAAASAGTPNLLGVNMWDVISVEELDIHSCETEALGFGHFHESGEIVHEMFCEMRKLWHYALNIVRNFKSALTLGPLIVEEVVADGALGFLQQLRHILKAVIAQPRHLLLLPEIIHDCVPFPSVIGAIHRIKHVIVHKVFRFAKHLVLGHIRNFVHHLFAGHRLGVHLLEKLASIKLNKLQHLGSLIPVESLVPVERGFYGEPEFIYTAPAATATATASSAATATAAASSAAAAAISDNVAVPDYYNSLGEILNSFRGFYNGYQASGIPHFIRTGMRNFSWTSTVSTVKSYLSRVPFLNSCSVPTPVIGSTVVEETVTTTNVASASASVSASSPVVAPVTSVVTPVAPVVPAASVIPVESESVSASASASASTTITEAQPIVYSEPIAPVVPQTSPVIPCETAPVIASDTAAATASAAASSPIISSYRTAPQVYASPDIEETYISPQIVSSPVKEVVSETSSSSVSVASASAASASAASPVAAVAPELVVPSITVNDIAAPASSAASAATSASASSAVEEIPSGPNTLVLNNYTPRILPPFAPATTGAASASASASSSNSISAAPIQYGVLRGLNIGRISIPYGTPARGVTSVVSSPAVASSSAAATSAASSGFNVILPREQIIKAIGQDYLLPGDVIAVTLKNRAILFGRVLDGTSPITFSFLKPHVRASILRNSGRIWKLLARDFRDPDCIRQFNNPLLLKYVI